MVYRPLVELVHQIAPDLIAVSGDLTQRARASEFQAARVFLDALPKPQIVVPGNHDVPLHNVYARFITRFGSFGEYITPDFEPFFSDGEIAALGVNTARSLVFKGGRVNSGQVARIEERFRHAQDRVKILVAHHPFDLPEHLGNQDLVGRAKIALAAMSRCNVDLVLSGHLHTTHTLVGRSAIFVQAGTALSTRERGEANSFNVIRVGADHIAVEQHSWDHRTHTFSSCAAEEFHRAEAGWFRA